MRQFSKIFVSSLMVVLSSCTAHSGYVDYKGLGVFSSETAGNHKFADVSPVSVSRSTWIWESCDSLATDAVRELLDIAKTRGATTVYKITFASDSGRTISPTCYKRWGWFFAYIVGGLGPWMTATSAEGMAATLDKDAQPRAGIWLRDGADTQALAASYIRSLPPAEIIPLQ